MIRTVTLPDGRELFASREGPLDDWVLRLPREDRVARGRWLLAIVRDLLDGPHGEPPGWVLDIVDQVSGYDTPLGRRHPCPCCDYLTLTKPPTRTFAICPVCDWEDDGQQFENLDMRGGANKVSLNEARENYRRHGRSDLAREGDVRPPLPEEHP